MRLSHRTSTIALLAALVPLMGADGTCGGPPILDNNGFDLWCGDQLCYWELEEGEVVRIPTWHAGDHGIELRGNVVALSQPSNVTASCLRFDAVANIDETATVTVEIDYFDDGVVDDVRQLPSSRWEPISYQFSTPTFYYGARFRIKKLGAGNAQLAELVVEIGDKCVDPPLEVRDRPLGGRCTDNDECASAICAGLYRDDGGAVWPGICSECEGDGDCPVEGEMCGLVATSADLGLYRACQVAGADPLAETCTFDAECATGICAGHDFLTGEGVCSTCASPEQCGGAACALITASVEIDDDPPIEAKGPMMCAPEQGTYASGELCVLDASCASGACSGTGVLRVCSDDDRLCDDDGDCRFGSCVAIGTAGGICQ